jgi:hypothetical protein
MATSPTLLDSAQLEVSVRMRQRARNALLTYSHSLMNAEPSDPQYNAKIQAARNMGVNRDMTISSLLFWLSGDAEVKTQGDNISDQTLQSVVEKTLQKLYRLG